MGIPRFYKWLKAKYPLIRFELGDSCKQFPQIDNFYIDFNALVYRCVVEDGTFLRNKIIPLTFKEIYTRVMEYLQELIEIVAPSKLLFIALDGVAPRAKINQSRDRRFKAGQDSAQYHQLMQKAGIDSVENFKHNSISPGTQFLFELCQELRKYVMGKMENDWKHLKVIYSDCSCPGQGEHKIMHFLRSSKEIKLFSEDSTHCIYSPDADVILLSLALGIRNLCLIKQDTSVFPPSTLGSVARFREPPKFELVIIKILSQYLQKEFAECIRQINNCQIQDIINDFILLMAFVGNDFLPSQFCFTLKDNHMDQLYKSYKEYLMTYKTFINDNGIINWQKVGHLLQIATKFQASMIQQKIKNYKANKQNPNYIPPKAQDNGEEDLQLFQVSNNKITKGRDNYYKTRFQLQNANLNDTPELSNIIIKYIQGLEFYCQYYFKGLPSWTSHYPYHYTPLLTDVYDYIQTHKIDVKLTEGNPFDPFMALMFMLPESSFSLLPKIIQKTLKNPECPLRKPKDMYPQKFAIDKYEPLKYNKRAIIPFLKEQEVRKVYQSINVNEYSAEELKRNKRANSLLFYYSNDSPPKLKGMQIPHNQQTLKVLKQLFPSNKTISTNQRFPTLSIYGKWQFDENGRLNTPNQFKYQNVSDPVFFNDFQGYIEQVDDCSEEMKRQIKMEYEKIGVVGKCDKYYIIKQCRKVRNINGFRLVRTRREVIVPQFALFKTPKYSYLGKTCQVEPKQLYSIGERVVVLNEKNFGSIGSIESMNDKQVNVKLSQFGYDSAQKVSDFDEDFYTLEYVANKQDISKQVLLIILDEICIFPQFSKKSLKDFLPQGLNFGLSVINTKKMLLLPQYARCKLQYENSAKPYTIFNKVELSKRCIALIQTYIEVFGWLIDYLENSKEYSRRNIYARDLFEEEEQPNIKLLSQFRKLINIKNDGIFYSIYSKVGNKKPTFVTIQKPPQTVLTLRYYEIISKKQAKIALPALHSQPQYHGIGDRVIYLRTLQTGIVTGIDDNMMYVQLAKRNQPKKVKFTDLFNLKWVRSLEKEDPTSWDLQTSYFQPQYWNPAIDLK